MEWLSRHMALVFAVTLLLSAVLVLFNNVEEHKLVMVTAFALIGIVFFGIWLTTRNER